MREIRSGIAKKKLAQLSAVEKQLKVVESKIAREEADIKRMKNKLRSKRIFMAGLVLEDVGILENFDPNALYHLLLEHRSSLVQDTSQGEIYYGKDH